MSTAYADPNAGALTTSQNDAQRHVTRRLGEYCEFVLGTLARVDQRRWGEVYIRGLLFCDGRRSIRRIAGEASGCSDQSLQQFINQSPWDPRPVRQRLARALANVLQPYAWVIEEMAFTKHGQHSAATERQFVPSLGRLCNAQLGAVASLACERAHVPVNWRLTIPISWDDDPVRRKRARIPETERHKPFWQYQLELLDDMAGDWGLPLAPAVLDGRHCQSVFALVAELDHRGLTYQIEVSGELHAAGSVPGRTAAACQGRRMLTGPPRWGTLAQLAQLIPISERTTVGWTTPQGHQVRSQFAAMPVRMLASDRAAGGRPSDTVTCLLVEWALGTAGPRGFWLTNHVDAPVAELVALAKTRQRVRHDLDALGASLGLGHHEGRSFLGWHHHVTLVSAAHAFRVLHEIRDDDEPIVPRQAAVPVAPLDDLVW